MELTSADGKLEKTENIFSNQRTVLIIYRGGWCPYCNRHLSAVGQAEKDILELGYQVVAVSPDSPEDLKATIEKQELNYKLYSDSDAKLIKSMG